jgi:hypothetical protein
MLDRVGGQLMKRHRQQLRLFARDGDIRPALRHISALFRSLSEALEREVL